MKNAKRIIAAALLAAVCIFGSGCGEPAPQDISEAPATEQEPAQVTSQTDAANAADADDAAGKGVFDRAFTIRDEISEEGFIIRRYYSRQYGQVAESFGYEEPRDVFRDIDGDGMNELICSVQYGGDGVTKALIYKWNDTAKIVVVGEIYRDEKYLPGLYDWGVGAVQSHYSLRKNCIVVDYSDGGEDYAVANFPMDSEAIVYDPYMGE